MQTLPYGQCPKHPHSLGNATCHAQNHRNQNGSFRMHLDGSLKRTWLVGLGAIASATLASMPSPRTWSISFCKISIQGSWQNAIDRVEGKTGVFSRLAGLVHLVRRNRGMRRRFRRPFSRRAAALEAKARKKTRYIRLGRVDKPRDDRTDGKCHR